MIIVKNNIIKLIIIFCLFIGFLSCGDDNSTPLGAEMKAIVDGINWKGVEPKAQMTDHGITISATSANGQIITFSTDMNIVGEHIISYSSGSVGIFIPNSSPSAVLYSTIYNTNSTGIIKIKGIDDKAKTISGKFSFTAYKMGSETKRIITEGSFTNVPYTYLGGGSTTNNIRFKVDGSIKEATMINSIKSNGLITISGSYGSGLSWKNLLLSFPAGIRVGEYEMSSTNIQFNAFWGDASEIYNNETGLLKILRHDTVSNNISGTFSFDGKYVNPQNQVFNKSITDGYFSVNYTR